MFSLATAVPFGSARAANIDFYSNGCPGVTLDRVQREFAGPAPFGKSVNSWTSPDFQALDTRYGACRRMVLVDASREVQALQEFLRPFVNAARERSSSITRRMDSKALDEEIASTGRYAQAENAQEDLDHKAQHQAYVDAHDPKAIQAGYLANTPLAGYEFGPDYFTSVDLGWVYSGDPSGPLPRCTLTMTFHTPAVGADAAPASELGVPHAEGKPVRTGALMVYWTRKSDASLIITKAGWHIPEAASVITTMSFFDAKERPGVDPGLAAVPGAGRYVRNLNGMSQRMNQDLTRQMAEFDPGTQPPVVTADVAFSGMSGILIHPVPNLGAMMRDLPDLARIKFKAGDEPEWISTGAGAEAASRFSACVRQATTVAAPPPSPDSKPY